jgi:hypothetical protein
MVMNKKGQAALVGLVIGIFIFLFGMGVIDPIKDVITEARAADQLNCSSDDLSSGTEMTCLAVDLLLPYFILIIFAVAGAWIGAKIIG